MKLTKRQLRKLIREEFRGVPLFAFREVTRKYIDDIRAELRKNILVAHSPSPGTQRMAFESMNEVLEEFELEISELLEDKLYNFLQRV